MQIILIYMHIYIEVMIIIKTLSLKFMSNLILRQGTKKWNFGGIKTGLFSQCYSDHVMGTLAP